jgi:hypothetical protein
MGVQEARNSVARLHQRYDADGSGGPQQTSMNVMRSCTLIEVRRSVRRVVTWPEPNTNSHEAPQNLSRYTESARDCPSPRPALNYTTR